MGASLGSAAEVWLPLALKNASGSSLAAFGEKMSLWLQPDGFMVQTPSGRGGQPGESCWGLAAFGVEK